MKVPEFWSNEDLNPESGNYSLQQTTIQVKPLFINKHLKSPSFRFLCSRQLINLDRSNFEFWISNICYCYLQAGAVKKIKAKYSPMLVMPLILSRLNFWLFFVRLVLILADITWRFVSQNSLLLFLHVNLTNKSQFLVNLIVR